MSAFQFATDGQLSAILPIVVEIDGVSHEFKILFTDEDSFDDVDFSVSLDFNACKVSSVLLSLMSHLGSSYLKPSDILGPMSTMSGIDFFSDAQGFDELFPSFENVLGGVVEGTFQFHDFIKVYLISHSNHFSQERIVSSVPRGAANRSRRANAGRCNFIGLRKHNFLSSTSWVGRLVKPTTQTRSPCPASVSSPIHALHPASSVEFSPGRSSPTPPGM